MLDLFEDDAAVSASPEVIAPGAFILRQAAAERVPALLEAMRRVIEQAPLRIMTTPAGLKMSVAMTNCGAAGWVSERSGYRYTAIDPLSGKPWPRMPAVFAGFASEVAARAGFIDFTPDACLINRYEPGVRLSLHQDRDERDFSAPIVSVSLGLPATFLFGGCRRSERAQRIALRHGDVVVWGGESRLRFHGVLPVAEGLHPVLGRSRINLTLRKAL